MESLEDRFRTILDELWLTDDPEREHTSAAFLGLLREFTGSETPPTLQPIEASSRDLVIVRGMPFHSLCVHHLVPFFGQIDLVYVPDRSLAGLGWFPRLVEHFARRPQLQERLVAQLADHVMRELQPRSLGLRLTARQMCMELRGARTSATTESVAYRGLPDTNLRVALQGG